MIIVCAGVIGRQPLPGQVWYQLQYLVGFRRLGHDVYFLEESGDYAYAYDFETMTESADPAAAAATIDRCLRPFGFGDRWAYRVGDHCFGIGAEEFAEICAAADVFIAPPTAVWKWRSEYDRPRVRVFLDVDPGFTQLKALQGDWRVTSTLERCNRYFTYGTAIASSSSAIPTLDLPWQLTRPPLVLELWPYDPGDGGGPFTTVMHWSLDESPVHDGETYGQKDVEFERVQDLPKRTSQPLEIAMNDGPFDRLRELGWRVVATPPTDLEGYRRYIGGARGEVSVAKNGYVKARSGWMSERTTCFLSSGRPAVVQETGLSDWVPTGEGLLTFTNVDEAAAAIDAVNSDYERHRAAARRLAEEHFASDLVLADFLSKTGV